MQQSDLWVASQPVTLSVAETLIELTLEKSSAEVGQETTILCKVSKPGSFEKVVKIVEPEKENSENENSIKKSPRSAGQEEVNQKQDEIKIL